MKFAAHHDVAMILANGASIESRWPSTIPELLSSASCDVVLSFPSSDPPSGAAVLVPFGGGEHDWAALELAAHLARLRDAPLVLTGAAAQEGADASRMLAVASLIVQRTIGVIPEPVMIAPGAAGVLDHAREAGLIVRRRLCPIPQRGPWADPRADRARGRCAGARGAPRAETRVF